MSSYEEQIAASLANLDIDQDTKDNVVSAFLKCDEDKSQALDVNELTEFFKEVNPLLDRAKWQIRDHLRKYDLDNSRTLSPPELAGLINKLQIEKTEGIKVSKSKKVNIKEKVEIRRNTTSTIQDSGHHQVAKGEVRAFSAFITKHLEKDADCGSLLPIKLDSNEDLFEKVQDGLLFCKLVNLATAGTISEKAINKKKLDSVYKRNENLSLAIGSAASIGCSTVSISPLTISDRREHIILGLIWQLLRKIAFKAINLKDAPNLAALLRDGESLDDIMNLSPEELLLRWFNYHLNKDPKYEGGEVKNFNKDITDSQAYISLLNRIQPLDLHPQLNYKAQGETDDMRRAEAVQRMADKLGCGEYITAEDIVTGNEHVNMLFCAQLFNEHPALEKPDMEELDIEETRDEATYRNWMNSLEVKPYVNFLYHALSDGIVILTLEDKIEDGCVNWKRVNQPSTYRKLGGFMKKIENCNYAVQIAKDVIKCKVIGIGGDDINKQNKMLTLAIVWQLMRAYTLKRLKGAVGDKSQKEADQIIVDWSNSKIQEGGHVNTFQSFGDPSLSNSMAILDLCDAISPGCVDYDHLDASDQLENARYALGCCRKIGARPYALPEHIVDCDRKMIMTVFACLMGAGMNVAVVDGENL